MMKRNFTIKQLQSAKILSIVLLFFSLFLTSCSDFFTPEDFSFSNIESFEQFENAVDGISDCFMYYISGNNFYNCSNFGDDQLLFDSQGEGGRSASISSDDYYYSYRSRGEGICKKGLESFNFYELEDWSTLYAMIASINNAVVQFNPDKEKDQKIRGLLGEMYFYRAYCYYRLTRIYGRIPLIDNTDVNYTIPKSSYVEVYEFIEADLLSALQLLPQNNASARKPFETPDRGTAKAMLAEVYLSWAGFPANDAAKYSLSAKVSGELIDSSGFYGYELLTDFEDLWNKKSLHNRETVFCYYFNRNEKSLKSIYLYYGYYYPLTQNSNLGFGIDRKTCISISESLMPEIEFYNNYPKGYRKDITFYTRIYVAPSLFYPGIDTGYIDIEKVDCKSRACYHKFFIDTLLFHAERGLPGKESYEFMGSPRIYLLRYAQTLLTYAEASARAGSLNAKAYECVNKVRRRANKQPLESQSTYDLPQGLSNDAFADSIVQERAWELAGEQGHRWFDMLRLGIVEKVYEKRDPADGPSFKYSSNDNYFYPIPEGDINLNPNLKE
jgi:starch-binding outer membrane protein, SusD/RagB family